MKITSSIKILNLKQEIYPTRSDNSQVAENRIQTFCPTAHLLKAYYMPAFTSVSVKDKKDVPLNSMFYRDYDSLLFVKKYLEEKFPHGGEVVVGACSTGEDLISLYSMLEERDKYKFTGVDLSEQAIEMAKNNHYGLCWFAPDSMMLNADCGAGASLLQKSFKEVMSVGEKPPYVLNSDENNPNVDITDEYFTVKPEHFKKMEFINDDMTKLDLETPACAIFFRQGIYQVADNMLLYKLFQRDFKPDDADKREKIEPLVDNIYKNLDKGGIFVIGDMPAEHFYIADKCLKSDEKIEVDKVLAFDNAIDYYMANPEVEIYKQSPLYEALFRDGRFDVVYESEGSITEQTFIAPTVWVKAR